MKLLVVLFSLVMAASQTSQIKPDFDHPAGMIVAVGSVSTTDHEAVLGYFTVNQVQIVVPPKSTAADVLRSYRNTDVEIVVRRTSGKRAY